MPLRPAPAARRASGILIRAADEADLTGCWWMHGETRNNHISMLRGHVDTSTSLVAVIQQEEKGRAAREEQQQMMMGGGPLYKQQRTMEAGAAFAWYV